MLFFIYIVGFLTHVFWNADVGLLRPAELDPYRRRVGGAGGEDANLPDYLEHLTANVAGLRMANIPIGMQGYTVDVSRRMRRVLRRVVAAVLCYEEHHPHRDGDSD
jgi:hypothetical protein